MSFVASIGKYAFANCALLDDLLLPPDLTTIETHAYEKCISLRRFAVSHSVALIGAFAFNFSGLTSLRIPRSVK